MKTAILECIELWDKETQLIPKFRLVYKEHLWEFRASNMGHAGTIARRYLDQLVFNHPEPAYYLGIDEKRILYKWKDDEKPTLILK